MQLSPFLQFWLWILQLFSFYLSYNFLFVTYFCSPGDVSRCCYSPVRRTYQVSGEDQRVWSPRDIAASQGDETAPGEFIALLETLRADADEGKL